MSISMKLTAMADETYWWDPHPPLPWSSQRPFCYQQTLPICPLAPGDDIKDCNLESGHDTDHQRLQRSPMSNLEDDIADEEWAEDPADLDLQK